MIDDDGYKITGSCGVYRCDVCGQFIPTLDFLEGRAIRQCVSVDTEHSTENYETLCKKHYGLKTGN